MRRSGILKAMLPIAIVVVGVVALRSFSSRSSPKVDVVHDLALYDQFSEVQGSTAVVAPENVRDVGDVGCALEHEKLVHVTGNSGTTYPAIVIGASGSDTFQLRISGKPYLVQAEKISECHSANALLTFWLPLLIGLALLCVLAYIIYKKVKAGQSAASMPLDSQKSRWCCGK